MTTQPDCFEPWFGPGPHPADGPEATLEDYHREAYAATLRDLLGEIEAEAEYAAAQAEEEHAQAQAAVYGPVHQAWRQPSLPVSSALEDDDLPF